MKPRLLWLFAFALVLPGCSDASDEPIRLYTSVTEATVTSVVDAFEADTGRTVEVFRAPTGELTGRIAAEQRSGGIQADVLWLTDPLSMQQYAAEGLLREWQPEGAGAVASRYKAATFWGTRILSMVIIQNPDLAPLTSWSDLASPEYAGRIAAPDPGFAGSALAVLAYFTSEPAFGFDYYRELVANGLVVVNAPGEVVTGVAEGRFDAGITLSFSAEAALKKGSPIAIVWPTPGAIAIYSPIAVLDDSDRPGEELAEFVLSRDAQQLIAATGWQPIRDDVPWDVGGEQVSVDWGALLDGRDELLAEYQSILDG